MRRIAPWALLLLVGLGAGLGAALGAAGSPGSPGTTGAAHLTGPEAQQWLRGVLAATKAAGTAHLQYSSVTVSHNPDLHQSGAGSGVVDFATGSFRVSETDHDIQLSSENGGPMRPHPETTTNAEIAIGRSLYENIGQPGFQDDWTKEPLRRDESELGLGSAEGFGGVLSALAGPFAAVGLTDLGTSVVSGEPATHYLVRVQIASNCPTSIQRAPLLGHFGLWVDAHGRLVQVRIFSSFDDKIPASFAKTIPGFADQPFGPVTVTSTLRLSAFGAPVHVRAPTVGGGRSFSVEIRASSKAVARCG